MQFPSKAFLPAIGVKKTTLHEWGSQGYIDLGEPGTGRSVVLTGKEVLLAAAMYQIHRNGGKPKEQFKGLRDCVHYFASDYEPGIYAAVLRSVDYGHSIEFEWEPATEPGKYITGERVHIVEGHGDKPTPYIAILILSDILTDLYKKLVG